MYRLLARRLNKSQRAITGIETAIILIAFVVVAAVFSYVAVSSGLFATQKSQEAIYNGLQEAQGATVIRGGIVCMAENIGESGYISQMTFTLSNAMGGQPIDFTGPSPDPGNTGLSGSDSGNKVIISYIDAFQKVDDLYWVLTKMGGCNDNNLLEANELFQVTIGNPVAGENGGNLVDALTHHLGTDTKFCLQVTTPVGSTLTIERTSPSFIDAVCNIN